jgi:hypothetical protein
MKAFTWHVLACAWLLQACGSSGYTHQSVDIIVDYFAGGDAISDTCADGRSCFGYGYTEMTNDGLIISASGCRPLAIDNNNPSKDAFCALYSSTQQQISAADLRSTKENVIDVNPAGLADDYPCDANNSCYSDVSARRITITIDGVSKQITWSDGGAAASAAFSYLLDVVNKIGL